MDDSINILLIDDQPITKILLGRMLAVSSGAGMVLHYVQDPCSAEAEAQTIQPTVILLDLMMPNLDGLELLQRFRTHVATQQIPIIILSSIVDAQHKAKAFALGANDYIIKLPDQVEMLARLRYHGNARLAHLHQQQAESALKHHLDHLEEVVIARTAKLQEALTVNKEREAFLRTILESALDAIISIDLHGCVVEFNPAAEKLFGYAKEEMMGQELGEMIIPPHYRAQHRAALARYASAKDKPDALKRRIELVGQHRSGMAIDLEVALTTIYRNGQLYFTAFLHDITDRKQLLKSLEETLGVAEEASKVKGDFLATMSHEIRTPMNAILGYNELALQKELSPVVRDYLKKANNASHSLMGIIDDILDFSKIEAGKMELDPVEFDLHELFDGLANLFMQQTTEKGLELILSIDPPFDRTLWGDRRRLEQVLINLIRNAIKFTAKGKIVVQVDRTDQGSGPVNVAFSVTDTGIGISPEQLSRLFKPFVQADSSTTRHYGGTGLGLAICKNLVERMGGHIGVTSRLGQGSTFSLDVPFEWRATILKQSSTSNGDRFTSVWYKTTEATKQIGGARILLVEDNAINQEIACELLLRVGVKVEVANSGEEAVEKVQQFPFDAVLMDIQLAGMSGLDATRQIRRDVRFKALPIIAMTAHVMAKQQQECLEAGMNAHLAKPIRPESLYGLLAQWMGPMQPSSPAFAEEDPIIIPEIEGIHQTEALQRLAGNRKLYRRLLVRFRKEYAMVGSTMEEALQEGAIKTAEHLAHSVKGIAGSLGAQSVYKAADVLEKAIRGGLSSEQHDALQAFVAVVTPLLQALAKVEEDELPAIIRSPREQAPMDVEALTPLLIELAKHLEGFSLETDAVMAHIHQKLASTSVAPLLREIEKFMECYEFNAARDRLETLANVLNIQLIALDKNAMGERQ